MTNDRLFKIIVLIPVLLFSVGMLMFNVNNLLILIFDQSTYESNINDINYIGTIEGNLEPKSGFLININSSDDFRYVKNNAENLCNINDLEVDLNKYHNFDEFYEDYFTYFQYTQEFDDNVDRDYILSPKEFQYYNFNGDCDDSATYLYCVSKFYGENSSIKVIPGHLLIYIVKFGNVINYDSTSKLRYISDTNVKVVNYDKGVWHSS